MAKQTKVDLPELWLEDYEPYLKARDRLNELRGSYELKDRELNLLVSRLTERRDRIKDAARAMTTAGGSMALADLDELPAPELEGMRLDLRILREAVRLQEGLIPRLAAEAASYLDKKHGLRARYEQAVKDTFAALRQLGEACDREEALATAINEAGVPWPFPRHAFFPNPGTRLEVLPDGNETNLRRWMVQAEELGYKVR